MFFRPDAPRTVHRSLPTGEMAMASSIARTVQGVCFFVITLLMDFGNTTFSRNATVMAPCTALCKPGMELSDTEGMPGAALTAMRYDTYGSSVRVICVPPTHGASPMRCASVIFAVADIASSPTSIFSGLVPP